jgi:hypothetical protein
MSEAGLDLFHEDRERLDVVLDWPHCDSFRK